ncbi:MAG: methyltransferase domain-containing protein, partial [Candidatus Sulfotelmatobacter sp.]
MIATQTEVSNRKAWGPDALAEVRDARRRHQETITAHRDEYIQSNRYFYDHLKRVLQFIVEPGKNVLDVRCETGHLLASVRPALGVGVEISAAMVERAQGQHPDLHFVQSDPEDLGLNQTFDYILFNHIFDTVDILRALERIKRHCTAETRIVVINYNHSWTPILELASKIGLRSQFVEPNWISENDIRGFLKLAGFRPVRLHRLMLFPKWIPGLSQLLNGVLAQLPGLRRLCMMQIMVARLVTEPKHEEEVTVSVVVPCRNEVGNVQQAVERIPTMGKHTEILFCDDKSTDGTADEVRRMMAL